MTQYQSYLKKLEEQNSQEDTATFSVVELKLDEERFGKFQSELNATIKDEIFRTIANSAEFLNELMKLENTTNK